MIRLIHTHENPHLLLAEHFGEKAGNCQAHLVGSRALDPGLPGDREDDQDELENEWIWPRRAICISVIELDKSSAV